MGRIGISDLDPALCVGHIQGQSMCVENSGACLAVYFQNYGEINGRSISWTLQRRNFHIASKV